MPLTIWTDQYFQDALEDRYNMRKPGVDQDRFKTAILDEIIKTSDSPAKTIEANKIMP